MNFSTEATNAIAFMTSFCLAALAVIWASPPGIVLMIVVLGQAHFALAYLYQWKAGKIGNRYLLSYAAIAGGLVTAYYVIPQPELWITVLAGTIFALHFFIDEIYIGRLVWSRELYLLCASFVALYGMVLVEAVYKLQIHEIIIFAVTALVAPLVVRRVHEKTVQFFEAMALVGLTYMLFILLLPRVISITAILGFIILAHYVRWYLFFLARFSAPATKDIFNAYVRNVVGIQIGIIIAYVLYLSVDSLSMLSVFFDPINFYIWTILHIVFSATFFHEKRKS